MCPPSYKRALRNKQTCFIARQISQSLNAFVYCSCFNPGTFWFGTMPGRFLPQSNILMFEIFFFSYDQAGEVLCSRKVAAHTCAKMSCEAIGYIKYQHYYPCNCYKLEKTLSKKIKWYQIIAPNGQYAYVTDTFCSADVSIC